MSEAPTALDRLIAGALSGEVSVEQAEKDAPQLPMDQGLVEVIVHAWLQGAHELARGGDWQRAWAIVRIIRSALEGARVSESSDDFRVLTAARIISIATYSLRQLPHPGIYASALEVARDAMQVVDALGRDDLRVSLLYALGCMHSDPYLSERSFADLEGQLRSWQGSLSRLADEADLRRRHGVMPPIVEALSRASAYLTQAESVVHKPEPRALVLAALSEVLDAEVMTGAAKRSERLVQVTKEALELQDFLDTPERARLAATLYRHTGERDDRALTYLLGCSLDEHVSRLGPSPASSIVLQMAAVLEHEPRRALELVIEARPLFEDSKGIAESARMSYWRTELLLLIAAIKAHATERPQTEMALQVGEVPADDSRTRAVELVDKAMARLHNRAREAQELVAEAIAEAPLLIGSHRKAFMFLGSVLAERAMVEAAQEGDFEGAATELLTALRTYLDLDLRDLATNALRTMQQFVRPEAEIALDTVVQGLGSISVRAEVVLGVEAGFLIRRICHMAARTCALGDVVEGRSWVTILQIVKGQRFAAALAAGTDRGPVTNPAAADLLQQLENTRLTSSLSRRVASHEKLLTAYARPEAEQPGRTPNQRRANLEHAFDALIEGELIGRVLDRLPPHLTSEQISQVLDDGTVLLNLFVTASQDRLLRICVTAHTTTDTTVFCIDQGLPEAWSKQRNRTGRLNEHPFRDHVANLRQQVLGEPDGPLPVRTAGAEILRDDFHRFFSDPVVEFLQEQRAAGKKHLAIVPTGPFHYYPLHLLGPVDRPLAGDWVISFLPNLRLLEPHRTVRISRPRYGLSAIGISFARYPALPAIPEAVEQSKEIAAMFDTAPLLDQDATKEAVIDRLVQSRFVHLATHGRNNVTAPALHSLLVEPDAEVFQHLYSYEIMGLDLSRIELLTTAACETGLGRFDQSDNVRGLPAALMLAGVQSMVVTLWPVGATSSRLFFKTLYRRLRDGASRGEAFAEAQRATRARFPEYRAWGAYALVGAWS